MSEAIQSTGKDSADRLSIHRVRLVSISNPHLGVAIWLDEFDHALLQRDFSSCQALLTEIHEGGYPLATNEQTFVDSRQAALLLCQGLSHYSLHQYNKAQQCYEASLRLHHALGNSSGEGQALRALAELDNQQAEPDNILVKQLMTNPSVLGNSNTLLIECLQTLPLAEQAMIIVAAKQSGYYTPLLAGLSSQNSSIQAAAATALTWLKPGPDYKILIDTMLSSPNWLVRWQAISILQQRIDEEDAEFARQWNHIHKALARCLEDGETDPIVRRSIALLLHQRKDTADASIVTGLLTDPDPDVRYTSIRALDSIGDAAALPALQQVRDGHDFLGNHIGVAAKTAIRHILLRLPTEIKEVILCQELTAQGQPVPSVDPFSIQKPPRNCSITILNLTSTTRITCYIRRQQHIIFHQERTLTGTTLQYTASPMTLLQEQEYTSSREQEVLSLPEEQELPEEELLIELIGAPERRDLDVIRQSLQSLLNEILDPDTLLTITGELMEVIRDQIDTEGSDFLERVQALIDLARDLIEKHGDVFLEMVQPLAEIILDTFDEHKDAVSTVVQSFREIVEQAGEYDRNDNYQRTLAFFGEVGVEYGQEFLSIAQYLFESIYGMFMARQDEVMEMIQPLIEFVKELVEEATEGFKRMLQPLISSFQEFASEHEEDFLAIIESLRELMEQFAESYQDNNLQTNEGIHELIQAWSAKISALIRPLLEENFRNLISLHGAEFSAQFAPLTLTVRNLIDAQRENFSASLIALTATVQMLLDNRQTELSGVLASFMQLIEHVERSTPRAVVSIQDQQETEHGLQLTHVLFSLSSPEISWSPGDYSLEIALNGVTTIQQQFQIVGNIGK